MSISQPRRHHSHQDYAQDCQEALDLPVASLIDQAIEAGWEPHHVYKATEELARMQALAYEDPDPAGE